MAKLTQKQINAAQTIAVSYGAYYDANNRTDPVSRLEGMTLWLESLLGAERLLGAKIIKHLDEDHLRALEKNLEQAKADAAILARHAA